jgi:hypothetical protein
LYAQVLQSMTLYFDLVIYKLLIKFRSDLLLGITHHDSLLM